RFLPSPLGGEGLGVRGKSDNPSPPTPLPGVPGRGESCGAVEHDGGKLDNGGKPANPPATFHQGTIMLPSTLDELQSTLRQTGPAAAIDRLCTQLREDKDYRSLFYALLMKRRIEL